MGVGLGFVRGAFGFGIGGGISFNPMGRFPGNACEGKRGFIGASGWAGGSLGPFSGGWSGVTGIHIRNGDNGLPKLDYIEEGGLYGSFKGKSGWGLRGGGGINIVDVGVAW